MKLVRLLPLLLFAAVCVPLRSQTEVAPGVRVNSAVSAVEMPDGGAPTVVPIHSTSVGDNAHTGSNIARGFVYSGQHNTVELPGAKSALLLSTSTPSFYVRLDPEDPSQREMITLVRLKPAKESRIVLNFTANAFGGGRKRHVDEVAVTKTDAASGFVKITPQQPLSPGEYGLVFLPRDSLLFADRVYDFSVPPK
jgi:hypothetical protein